VSQPLIRGRSDPTLAAGGSGCGGCATSKKSTRLDVVVSLAGLGALLLLAMRRRSRRFPKGAAAVGACATLLVAASTEGCACGSSGGSDQTGCGSDCNQPCQEAIPMGLVGSYTSVAKAKDGTIWVAGYNEEYAPPTGEPQLYGDLVVGKYDLGKQRVGWTTVDGLPARTDGTCPDNDPAGWRKGETDPGDDVGLWTTMQLDGNDDPMVAYYDATHGALKFTSYDGHNWATPHTVSHAAQSDIGRYAKMILVDGSPVIAHLVMEPGLNGKMRTKIVLAKATTPTPHQASDWAFEDTVTNEDGPCRASVCTSDQVCVKDTGACQPKIDGCTPADCGTGKACVTISGKATCSAVVADTVAESYPDAYGDYVNLAKTQSGLGIVFYDRVHGNLVAASNAGGAWSPVILDGETGTRPKATDTGDDGIGASLYVDANDNWHVTYVNGITEALTYLVAPGGANPKPEIVDDGAGEKIDGKPFADGKHVVGDDSYVQVDDNGTVTIAYQDATAGTLRIATGTEQQTGHNWSLKVVDQTGKFAGYFPHPVPDDAQWANWFRAVDPASKESNGDVAFVTP
jgi:hypothetical protein